MVVVINADLLENTLVVKIDNVVTALGSARSKRLHFGSQAPHLIGVCVDGLSFVGRVRRRRGRRRRRVWINGVTHVVGASRERGHRRNFGGGVGRQLWSRGVVFGGWAENPRSRQPGAVVEGHSNGGRASSCLAVSTRQAVWANPGEG